MIEVPSPVSNESNVLATQTYTGLHLEPPTRDVVSFVFFFAISHIHKQKHSTKKGKWIALKFIQAIRFEYNRNISHFFSSKHIFIKLCKLDASNRVKKRTLYTNSKQFK